MCLDLIVGLLLIIPGILLIAGGRVPFATLEARGVLVRIAGGVLVLALPAYLVFCVVLGGGAESGRSEQGGGSGAAIDGQLLADLDQVL